MAKEVLFNVAQIENIQCLSVASRLIERILSSADCPEGFKLTVRNLHAETIDEVLDKYELKLRGVLQNPQTYKDLGRNI